MSFEKVLDELYNAGNLPSNASRKITEREFYELLDIVVKRGTKYSIAQQIEMIEYRFGLNGQDFHTLRQTGEHYGISAERIRQRLQRLFSRIRRRVYCD